MEQYPYNCLVFKKCNEIENANDFYWSRVFSILSRQTKLDRVSYPFPTFVFSIQYKFLTNLYVCYSQISWLSKTLSRISFCKAITCKVASFYATNLTAECCQNTKPSKN